MPHEALVASFAMFCWMFQKGSSHHARPASNGGDLSHEIVMLIRREKAIHHK